VNSARSRPNNSQFDWPRGPLATTKPCDVTTPDPLPMFHPKAHDATRDATCLRCRLPPVGAGVLRRVQIAKSMGALGGAGPAAAEAAPAASLPGLGGMLGGGAGGTPISAGLGNAASPGKLSVPSSWAGRSHLGAKPRAGVGRGSRPGFAADRGTRKPAGRHAAGRRPEPRRGPALDTGSARP
jgi:hypothetical protein